MLAVVSSATLSGITGIPVRVEVHSSPGLPGFSIVGMPDAACREARDRVRAALISCGLQWPTQKVTVNLAPSAVRKTGASLDLAIALALLVATEQLEAHCVAGRAYIGELGLDGSIRSIPGVLPMVASLSDDEVVVATPAMHDAALAPEVKVRPATTLFEVVSALRGEQPWPDPPTDIIGSRRLPAPEPDMSEVRGQRTGRLAVEIAAAGGHHLLMMGPPGSGKTMLARRVAGLMPPLDDAQALEVSLIHSAVGRRLPVGDLIRRPPVRMPHHGTSAAALVGGGSSALRPGEISLSHRGVLFLDELGEFAPHCLEMMREPLEEGVIRVTRAAMSATFPARFLLVASMNPCPCGEAGKPGSCRCSDRERLRYARRLSGPLLDRFDLRIMVSRASPDAIVSGEAEESSDAVAARVGSARERAALRGVVANADLADSVMDEVAPITTDARDLLRERLASGALSARGVQRIRRVALTVADLGGVDPPLDTPVIATALGLRTEPGQLLSAVGV